MARGKPREQRKHPRISSRFPVLSETEPRERFEMESVNLSLEGVYCTSGRYVPPMTKLRVTLHLPSLNGSSRGSPDPIQADAVVVRVEPSGESKSGKYRLALFFSRMEGRDRIQLARYLDLKRKETP